MRTLLVAFVLSILSISASAQPAQRTFVSTSGLDTNSCSRSAPCRNFAAAVAAVASRGEVVALDSGGYGPVTISKEVSIISPAGVYAAITAFSGSAILVSAPASIVSIRGLTINSLGGQDGIELTDATDLHVENVVITRFTNAMNIHAGSAGADFTVRDAEIRDNDGGISITSVLATTRGSIDRSRFDENGGAAVSLMGQGSLWIRDSVFFKNMTGVSVDPGSMSYAEATIEGCMFSAGTYGVVAKGYPCCSPYVYISDSSMTGLTWSIGRTGLTTAIFYYSFGNNRIANDGNIPPFDTTYALQ